MSVFVRLAAALSVAASASVAAAAPQQPVVPQVAVQAPRWSASDLAALVQEIGRSAQEGLTPERYGAAALQRAIDQRAPDLEAQASRAALLLAHDYAEGAASADARTGWEIARDPIDLDLWLREALARHDVAGALQALLPRSSGYAALRAALPTCDTPAHCTTLKINLERWRWLPRALGAHYLWVNPAAYRLDLIEGDHILQSHRIIVGKPTTPTPVFAALVTGVTANPWWTVPSSIVSESVGAMVRNRPAQAARLGYVATRAAGGRLQVRQRPGPLNALGQVKIEMPNAYSIFLHDTPSRGLFEQERRAFSHGCVRTEHPDVLARTLLAPASARSFDHYLTQRTNHTFALDRPVPVYIVYFTAVADPAAAGGVAYLDDVYGRDAAISKAF
jgi:L,D-transpeptidase YcbB